MHSVHEASQAGDLETVDGFVKANPEIVFSKDVRGRTPLHWASSKGHSAIAEFLLASRAEVNAADNDGWTPLHCASLNGQTAIVALLLASGADTHAKDNKGNTPYHLALAPRNCPRFS
jgi:ankyrin repeat protein